MKDLFAKERAEFQARKTIKKEDDSFAVFLKPLLSSLKGDLEPLIKSVKGKDGKTPLKGSDYFTASEIQQIKDEIIALIPPGEKGKDGVVDYNTISKLVTSAVAKLPKPKDGKDGSPGRDAIVNTAKIVDEVLKNLPKTKEYLTEEKLEKILKDKIPNSPEKRVVGYSSLSQLTDVILDGVPQDSKGNYILTPGGSASISDTAYGPSWDGDTTTAPSKNAVYDKIETLPGGHAAVTVTDSAEINFTLTGQDITASLLAGSIDETKLDASVNASLDLADSAVQPGDPLTDLTGDLPFSQIAQIATTRILGRETAGTGDIESLTAAQARNVIGLDTDDSPHFTAVNIGHATDTTVTRVSAGVIAVEGVTILRTSDVDDVPVNGATTDPISSNWAFDHEADTSTHGVTTVAGISETQTFTNKNLTSATNVLSNNTTDTSTATPTPVGSSYNNFYTLTALATNATFAAPSGTPANGNRLIIRIKDNGTSRTLAYNAIYRAIGLTLPTATTISKTIYLGCVYNSADSVWDVIAYQLEA